MDVDVGGGPGSDSGGPVKGSGLAIEEAGCESLRVALVVNACVDRNCACASASAKIASIMLRCLTISITVASDAPS